MIIHERIAEIEKEICSLPMQDFSSHTQNARDQSIQGIIQERTATLGEAERNRIWDEFEGFGPIEPLLKNEEITEILINGPSEIWFEERGQLQRLDDHFASELRFRHFVERLCHQAKARTSLDVPMGDGQLGSLRLHIVSPELTHSHFAISLRRHPKSPWTLESLTNHEWCSAEDADYLRSMIKNRHNFLIVGPTSAGKTSILNACLQELRPNERTVIIEDTSELSLPNSVSLKILSRQSSRGELPEITQTELIRQSLRMRPDRLVVGEIRGGEAKDLLMALSTGHAGSLGSLHANSAQQALLRLEMLIQLGAPNWSLRSIRSLMFLSLQYLVVTTRTALGQRRLQGVFRLCSLEEHGFLLEQVR